MPNSYLLGAWSSLGGIAAGRDGNLWFTDFHQHAVGRITPRGAITEFSVPGTGGPEGITAGPNGDIWMVAPANLDTDLVLRISPAGDITRFPVGGTGAGAAGLRGIAAGPDGNIWFTEWNRSHIGRMTPAGVVSEFALSPARYPVGIVAGPDGNLWFTESSVDRPAIARITPRGEIVEYPLLGGSVDNRLNPTAVGAGPDGNVWFTERGNIGRITPTGAITVFPLAGVGLPGGLVEGPDRNLWFTDEGTNSVGRISPTGAIREFALPSPNADPLGIAAGSDGRLWFTEASIGRIASIGVTVPEVTLGARVLTFGSGSTPSTRTLSVANTGDGVLRIATVALGGADEAAFTIISDNCSGRSVAVGARCQVTLAFVSGAGSGLWAGRLRVIDNGTGSPQTVSLVAQLADCRLPVMVVSRSPNAGQGKFLRVSTGEMTDDPNAAFDYVPGGSVGDIGLYRTRAKPILYGFEPASYDQALGRWLPDGFGAVSQDGSRYTYMMSSPIPTPLHVVDVATGRDRQVDLVNGLANDANGNWTVLAFAPEGIYVDQRGEGGIGPGLWLVNPETGTMRQVFADGIVGAVADGAAWIQVLDPKDPSPPPQVFLGPQFDNELVRRDLATGATTTWLFRPGEAVRVVAASGGVVLVQTSDDQQQSLWIVSGPNETERVTVPETVMPSPWYTSGMVDDSQGVWLRGLDGIYLWTPRTAAILVWDGVGTPAGKCA